MQAAADWIIRQRTLCMKDVPNREDLHVAGLMPPCMLGDYAIPSCDWHWYYVDNALSMQGLQRFADALLFSFPKSPGQIARDFKCLDSYRYGIVHLGGKDVYDLRTRCEEASGILGWPAPYAHHETRANIEPAPRPALSLETSP